MKKRKISALLLAGMMMSVSFGAVEAFADNNIKIVVNGEKIDFTGEQPPVIQNGRTLVPFRAVFEKMGAEVQWFQDIQLCEAEYGGISVGITIGDTTVTLGEGASIQSDVPAQIINNRTMVPLRVLSEGIGADVNWDASTKTITVETPDLSEEAPVKLDYEMGNAGVNNMDKNLLINYAYPIITTDYGMKKKLNETISADVTKAIDDFSDHYKGDKTVLNADCEVTYNDAGIFILKCTIEGQEVVNNGYGIANATIIEKEALNIIMNSGKDIED